MEAALRAIAEPRRRQILALVRANELSAGEIAAQFDVTWPAISQHLNVLKDAGLVNERRAGTRRLYRARPEGFEELVTFLEGFWDERLATLKREAELDEAGRCRRPLRDRGRPRGRDRRIPGDDLAVPGRPGQGRPLDGRRRESRCRGPAVRYRVEVLPGDAVLGEFVELDPPRRLVQTWGWETASGSVPPGSTTVAFDLVQRDDGTLVRVTHAGLSRGAAVDRHARGWDHYLPRLASVASGGDPGTDPWIERPERMCA